MNSQVFQVNISQADYATGLSALVGELFRTDKARKRQFAARLVLGMVLLVVLAYAFPYSLPSLVTAALMMWLGDVLIVAAFKTQTVGVSFDPAVHGDTRVTFSDEGIEEAGALRTRRWTWDAVRQVHLSASAVTVQLNGWDMIVLPHGLWSSPAERNAFVAALEAKCRSGNPPAAAPTARELEARIALPEPVLFARLSLITATFHMVFENQLPLNEPPGGVGAYLALGTALLAAAAMWWGSKKAFERLAARSPEAAYWTATGLFLGLGTAFVFWYLRAM